jgi:DNA-binding protein
MSEEQKALSDVLDESAAKKKRVQKTEEEEPAPQQSEDEEKSEEKQEEPAPEQADETEEKSEEGQAEPAVEETLAEEPPAEEKQPEPEREPVKKAPEISETPKPKKKIEQNVVLVGKKPTMSYVLATVTQFSDGLNQVHIKARGRSISRAVDVAEVVKNRFVQNLQTEVNIGTQEITDENNNKINVSTIDIVLTK